MDMPDISMPEFNIEEVMPDLTDLNTRVSALRAAVEWCKGPFPSNVVRAAEEFEDYINGRTREYHDEDTLDKVHSAIEDGLRFDYNATEIISSLQNAGILFRERAKGR